MKNGDALDERSRTVLRALVREYIRAGEPVGSRTLSRITRMNLSPATMRNIMADLAGARSARRVEKLLSGETPAAVLASGRPGGFLTDCGNCIACGDRTC